ncbi:MAG: hypothetical protein ACOCM4_02170 [Acetivibrio ethanolgignens]
MAAITKEEYEFFKSQNPEDLTQEELNWINEYEKAEAGAPSAEDIEWATFILNERDPQIQAVNRKNGDFDKAMKLMQQLNASRQVMQQKGQDPYVKKVKSTPEDIVEKGGFKFNWRDAYEQTKGEKLKATEADAKKLQEFINSNMFNIDDDVKLQQIAYNLHMYNPNTMTWSDFINSEQGDEFKKYLEDVRKAQTEKAVEDVWEGKDKSKLVDFMLPVSKEYAKNHYNDEDFSMVGPLMTDVGSNLIMTGSSLPSMVGTNVAKVMNKPLVSFLYGNVAAPIVTETGNAVFNDESIPEAFARTVEGAAVNIGTPRILEGMLSSAGRGLPKGNSRAVQKMIDESANKAAEVNSKIMSGTPYPILDANGNRVGPFEYAVKDGKVTHRYSSDPAVSKANHKSYNYKPLSEMPNTEVISDVDYLAARQGLPFTRGKKDFAQESIPFAQDKDAQLLNDLTLLKAKSLAKDGDLRNLTPAQIRQLGFANKESMMNYFLRILKTQAPETLTTYMTNAAGRPEFGREAGPIENINRLLGTNLFGKDKTQEEKQKSRIQRLLGM